MSPEVAEQISQTIRNAPLVPTTAAESFVERMSAVPLEENLAFPVRVDRRRESVAAAIRLVALNAEMAETIRGVLDRSALPVPGDTHNDDFHGRVREELEAALLGVLPELPSASEADGWGEIAQIVAGSLFGASLKAAA